MGWIYINQNVTDPRSRLSQPPNGTLQNSANTSFSCHLEKELEWNSEKLWFGGAKKQGILPSIYLARGRIQQVSRSNNCCTSSCRSRPSMCLSSTLTFADSAYTTSSLAAHHQYPLSRISRHNYSVTATREESILMIGTTQEKKNTSITASKHAGGWEGHAEIWIWFWFDGHVAKNGRLTTARRQTTRTGAGTFRSECWASTTSKIWPTTYSIQAAISLWDETVELKSMFNHSSWSPKIKSR